MPINFPRGFQQPDWNLNQPGRQTFIPNNNHWFGPQYGYEPGGPRGLKMWQPLANQGPKPMSAEQIQRMMYGNWATGAMNMIGNWQNMLNRNRTNLGIWNNKLGSISDQLNAAPPPPGAPPAPTPPTGKLGGPLPPSPVDATTQPNYVSSDRLNAGKGWAKFRNQAMGTDQFDLINRLFHRIRSTPSTVQGLPGFENWYNSAQQGAQQFSEFGAPDWLRNLINKL